MAISSVKCGEFHVVAIDTSVNKYVWAWGDNSHGQLGNGTFIDSETAIQVSNVNNAADVVCGHSHTFTLDSYGYVWAWGANSTHQLGNGTNADNTTPAIISGLSGITSIASGYYHGLALQSDGTVWAWGDNSHGQLGDGTYIDRDTPVHVQVGGVNLTNVEAIGCGDMCSWAIKSDGTVWMWGFNGTHMLGNNSNTDSPTPVQVQNLP